MLPLNTNSPGTQVYVASRYDVKSFGHGLVTSSVKVTATRFGADERRVGDAEVAERSARTRHVQLVDDVSGAADVAEV